MAKFMQQRGVKKLLKDRLAVVSMWVIGAYLLVALGVLVGNLFTEGGLKSETELRIGPDNVPGAWATQSAEARLRDATFYLDSIKKASRGSRVSTFSTSTTRSPRSASATLSASVTSPSSRSAPSASTSKVEVENVRISGVGRAWDVMSTAPTQTYDGRSRPKHRSIELTSMVDVPSS